VAVGINGFGRTGRQVLRAILAQKPSTDVVMVNDLAPVDISALLLQYDTEYGRYPRPVRVVGGDLEIGDTRIVVSRNPDPSSIRWDLLNVDTVVEATGHFNRSDQARGHLNCPGVERVVVCAPSAGAEATVVFGTNGDDEMTRAAKVISAASCTTTAAAPILSLIDKELGIERVMLTAVHAYTNSQRLLDKARADPRDSRSGPGNIVPSQTGAATLLGMVLPRLAGRVVARSIRVPTPAVSLLDLSIQVTQSIASAQEVNDILDVASRTVSVGILGYTNLPLVSSDFILTSNSSVISGFDSIVDGNWLRLLAWYDHEYGYASRVADLVEWLEGAAK
jgi:glyceraldehyde 3-phosphate dehydrogenase